ncbi:MAG: PaaI family thioesterase, partial [Anaerolineales bacterium]
AKLEVRYRHSVPLDTDLVITARIVKHKGRAATAAGEITLPDGTVAVEATGVLFEIPPEEIDKMGARDYLGWKVYTDEEYAQLMDELNQ